MEIVKDLYDRIMKSPIGQSLLKEDEAARIARRKELAGRLKANEAAIEKSLPALQKATRDAATACAKAEAALTEARGAHARAFEAERSAQRQADRARPAIEAELRATASPAIAAFIEDLDKSISKARFAGPTIEVEDARPPLYQDGWDKPPIKKGDRQFKYTATSQAPWVEAMIGIRRQAAELWREALDEAEVAARLDGMSAELDRVEAAA